jgi:hypothetical protein
LKIWDELFERGSKRAGWTRLRTDGGSVRNPVEVVAASDFGIRQLTSSLHPRSGRGEAVVYGSMFGSMEASIVVSQLKEKSLSRAILL